MSYLHLCLYEGASSPTTEISKLQLKENDMKTKVFSIEENDKSKEQKGKQKLRGF